MDEIKARLKPPFRAHSFRCAQRLGQSTLAVGRCEHAFIAVFLRNDPAAFDFPPT
jgi:hypothetical protein